MIIALFSVAGFTMGMTTEAVMFIPLAASIVALCGYEAVVGVAMIFVGTNIGFTAGIFNPFSVGIAQAIAEIPLYSGAWVRCVIWVALLVPGCVYTHKYAIKSKKTQLNYTPAQPANKTPATNEAQSKPTSITAGQVAVLFILAASIAISALGISRYGWYLPEIAVVFLLAGIAASCAGRLGVNGSCELFTTGAKKMMGGVLIIGLAATIRTILSEGNIIDAIANALITQQRDMPGFLRLPSLMWGNAALNMLITSASGKAVIVMPIMTPIADLVGFSRQAAVLAFQLGDGITNLTSPLSTTLNAAIAVSGITFGKWFKFYYPLVGIYLLVATVIMLLVGLLGY